MLARPSYRAPQKPKIAKQNAIKRIRQNMSKASAQDSLKDLIQRFIKDSSKDRLEKGITWISVGSRRHEWWKRSDQSTSFHRLGAETAAFEVFEAGFHDPRQALGLGKGELYAATRRLHSLEAACYVEGCRSARKGWDEFNTSSRSLRDLPLVTPMAHGSPSPAFPVAILGANQWLLDTFSKGL